MSTIDPEMNPQDRVHRELEILSAQDRQRRIAAIWGLLFVSLLLYLAWGFWLAGGIGVAAVIWIVATRLLIAVPVGIATCFLTARLLKTSFGTLGFAIVKLATLVIVTDAVYRISFEILDPSFGSLLAFIACFFLALLVYFCLLAWLFDLDLIEAFYFAVIMAVIYSAVVALANHVLVWIDQAG